ncbi:MAG TPA: pyridoxal-phosphate dependent enzyme [Steroidobacteraceae bacterium]|nr:pyridoxal-phosphate dependent enzyme [Steroidobacteraceae bacterium]
MTQATSSSVPTFDLVRYARERIGPFIRRTPVLTSRSLDSRVGAQLFFKCENFQRAGVFKARGAFNAVLSLGEAEARRGVVTSSSGNQAAALSLAARSRGIPAYLAMPKVALKSKVAAVERYGGRIVWVEARGAVPTSEEYEATAQRIQEQTGAAPVHPYNDPRTIAGQGTCALEFLEEQPELDFLFAPVGGGGLLSGTALAAKGLNSRLRVIGCEPELANDAQQSLRLGKIVPQLQPRTIADGLRTSLGDLTFALIARHVDDIVTVSEESIVSAMRLAWETLKIIIEPSSAVALAAVLDCSLPISGQSVGVILSGGNVDLDRLPWTPVS